MQQSGSAAVRQLLWRTLPAALAAEAGRGDCCSLFSRGRQEDIVLPTMALGCRCCKLRPGLITVSRQLL